MVTEKELAAAAFALIGDTARLTPQERKLIAIAETPVDLVESARALIAAGGDPLGELFGLIRSPERRRNEGATYTPTPIVDAMIAWAARQPSIPARIVDAGTGSGRFLMAAARQFPNAKLIAVELDPLAALLVRANAAVQGFASRLSVQLIDYRKLTLPRIKGF